MKQLQQQLLKDDLFIPGLVRESAEDPCLQATATASSVNNAEIFLDKHGTVSEPLPLDVARTCSLGFNTMEGDIHELWLWLKSENPQPVTLQVGAQVHGDVDSVTQTVEDFFGTALVPPMHTGWLKVDIHIPVRESQVPSLAIFSPDVLII